MSVLSALEPKAVFHYFEELCAIPHGSGNTKQISDYLKKFADDRNLRCIQDESNNIIIFKDGTPGYESAPSVILQGHMDMVCEKTKESTIDFLRDGLTLRLEDGIISAEGTTLGGDDGVAVAYALAILDADDIPHPPLEVVLTVDEEIGLLGAAAIDCTPLQGRMLLNLDSEEEGTLLSSCAGGSDLACYLPVERKAAEGVMVALTVGGLLGGHSGVEIDKGRGNANQLLGRTLWQLSEELDFALVSVEGGLKDNAIPRESVAKMVVNAADWEKIAHFAAELTAVYGAELRVTDPDVRVTAELGEEGCFSAMDAASQSRVIAALVNLPGGVQRMSADIPGLVQSSLNMGILKTSEVDVLCYFSVRSSVRTEMDEMHSRVRCLMKALGGRAVRSADYPAWEYRAQSPLRDLMVEVYEEQYGEKPQVMAIHAGVECGLFSGKLPGLDCVSFGPTLSEIHTVEERMDVASVQRVWKYLLEVLRRLK